MTQGLAFLRIIEVRRLKYQLLVNLHVLINQTAQKDCIRNTEIGTVGSSVVLAAVAMLEPIPPSEITRPSEDSIQVDDVFPQSLRADHGNCVIRTHVDGLSFVMIVVESKVPSPAVEFSASENLHAQFRTRLRNSSVSKGVDRVIHAIGKALLVKHRIFVVGIALPKKLPVEVVRRNEPIDRLAHCEEERVSVT